MATKSKRKLKHNRGWLENSKFSNSYYILDTEFGEVALTLADCNRRISWSFGAPGSKRGKAKIKKIKALIDEVYEYMHEED